MITYENAMMELNFPGSIGNQKKRRIAGLLKALHDENIKLKAEAELAGKEKNDANS